MARKIEKSLEKQWISVSLYKDDIEKIIRILGEGSVHVSVRTSNFLFEGVEDFWKTNTENRPSGMVISRSDPYVLVTMQKWGMRVESFSDAALSKGMFHLLCDVVREHRRWYYPRPILSRLWQALIASVIIWLVVNVFLPMPVHMPPFASMDGVIHGGLLVIALALASMRLERADIHLDVRRDAAPWIERQWAVVIVPAVIAIGSAVAAHYWPAPP